MREPGHRLYRPARTGHPAGAAQRGEGRVRLDRAQASVCYPGYPRQGPEENDAAFRYRRIRSAAHVDGLRRVTPGRRRKLEERHAFILGLPLNDAPSDAAPLVVWEGAHEVMRTAFRSVYSGVPPLDWAHLDVTEAYQAARRVCFDTLNPVEISAKPGEAYLVHRLALHGVAEWRASEGDRRAVAYFRPDPGEHDGDWWIETP